MWLLVSKCILWFLLVCLESGYAAGEVAIDGENGLSCHPSKTFSVFDGTKYMNKPDLSKLGINPANILYDAQLWDKGESREDLPRHEMIANLAREAVIKGMLPIIDIEHWPLRGEDETVIDSIKKYITVVRLFREAAGSVQLGYYGAPPVRDYWRALRGIGTKEYLAWQVENDRLIPLAEEVDIIFPSVYTHFNDRQAWVKYAVAQIREARRYGKPVYAFIWPQFHESNRLRGLSYLPADYWRLQLETICQYADGVVIWGGWDFDKWQPQQWMIRRRGGKSQRLLWRA